MAHSWSQSEFAEDTDPTWENSYKKHVSIDSNPYVVEFSDFERLVDDRPEPAHRHVSNFDGVVFVFSLTDYASFEAVRELVQKLTADGQLELTQFVFVGAKADLATDLEMGKVPSSEGAELATLHHTSYFEVSSMTFTQVEQCFQALTKRIVDRALENRRNNPSAKRSSPCSVM